MAAMGAAQYIDRMLLSHLTATTTPRIHAKTKPQDWRRLWRMPGQCMLCHQWQWRAICQTCEQAFAASQPRCQRCALPLHGGQSHCLICEDYPPEFDRAVAAVDYTSPWRELIASLKFKQDTALATPLAGLLAQRIKAQSQRSRPQWIIPTPLSAERLRERGFNQSWLLAQALSKQLGIPTLPHALRRVKETPRMMTLQANERRHHIRNAFAIAPEHRRALAGRHVAVVDDVLTSGATLHEIALTLRPVGVRSISVWVVARTPAPYTRVDTDHAD